MEPDKELESLIRDFLKIQGVDLVEINVHRAGKNIVVRLAIDRPEGGITIGECSRLNRSLGDLLEEQNVFQDSYILEVNSPGLDRPLCKKEDFNRCVNREVKFFLSQAINGKIEMDGLIQEVCDDGVDILTPDGIMRIPFANIHKAKQLIK